MLVAPVGAQPDPCDGLAARLRLDGLVGYQQRVSDDQARRNREGGKPLADPYCEGVFRSPVSASGALSLSVQSSHFYSRQSDPQGGQAWTVAWPFVAAEEVEGLGIAAHIRGRSATDGANYQLDAVDSTPDECDHQCQGDDPIKYESFTWNSQVLQQATEHQLQWLSVDVVIARPYEHQGEPYQLYMPAVLNPGVLLSELESPVPDGRPPLRLQSNRLVVRITSSVPVEVFAAAAYPVGHPELADERKIPASSRPGSLTRNQRDPFIIDVGGWQGKIVQLDVGTRWQGQDVVDKFFFYVPEPGFVAAVVQDAR